jgi:hypothetical protein
MQREHLKDRRQRKEDNIKLDLRKRDGEKILMVTRSTRKILDLYKMTLLDS